MKIKELKEKIKELDDDLELVIALSMPSIGPQAVSEVVSLSKGFDWDQGKVILTATDSLAIKQQKESIYDDASSLLLYLATKPSKKESYETRTAKSILLKNGYSEEDFKKYQSIYHN